jgi:hypothetical protein
MFLTLPLLLRAISFTGSNAGGRRKRIPRKHTFDYDPAKDCYVERQSAAEVARDALREKARLAQLAKEERAKKAKFDNVPTLKGMSLPEFADMRKRMMYDLSRKPFGSLKSLVFTRSCNSSKIITFSLYTNSLQHLCLEMEKSFP